MMKSPLALIKQTFCTLVLGVILTGCGSNMPPKEEAKRRIFAELPPYFSLQNGEVEVNRNGDGQFECNVALVVMPKEKLFIQSAPPTEIAHILGEVIDKEQNGEITKQLSQTMNEAVQSVFEKQKFLAVKAEAAKPVTVYGRISATQFGKDWEWGHPNIEKVDIMDAKPRSAFPSAAILVKSEEAAKAVQDLRKRINEIEFAQRQRDEKAKADRESKKALFLDSIKTGALYTGVASNGNGSEPIELKVVECDTKSVVIKIHLKSLLNDKIFRNFSGTFSFEGTRESIEPALILKGERPEPGIRSDKAFEPISVLFKIGETGITLFLTPDGNFTGKSSGYAHVNITLTKKP
jgi:hypothetical protein